MSQTKKAETKTEPKAEMRRPVMSQSFYLGPSIKGVISTKVTTVAERAKVAPGMVEALFVPIEKLSEAEEALKKQSKINTCYKEVFKAINKEV